MGGEWAGALTPLTPTLSPLRGEGEDGEAEERASLRQLLRDGFGEPRGSFGRAGTFAAAKKQMKEDDYECTDGA